MLDVNPRIRLLSAILLTVAVFFTKSTNDVIIFYIGIIIILVISKTLSNHIRFVFIVTMPILIALAILWGWFMNSSQVPKQFHNGIEYSFYSWLRIITWGGTLQFLFIPLVNNPIYLRSFFDKTGMGGRIGTLFIASIIFLPEMRRRLQQIIDARHAQGKQLSGVKGLLDLPTLLMPLISSLLDSAAKRAEFWSHRGLVSSGRCLSEGVVYKSSADILLLSITASILVATILI